MIKKTSETRVLAGNIVNAYNNSQTSAYSTEYINDLVDYSTDEIVTGKKWIDGKPVYRKVIDFGNLPNATTKAVNHNISNLKLMIKCEGITDIQTNGFTIPYISSTSTSQIYTYFSTTQIVVQTQYDRSAYKAYFILEYTKTTD